MDVHGSGDQAAGRRVGLLAADPAEVLEAEVEQFGREARRIAAGGWRRAVLGVGLGVAAGLAAVAAIPRDGR